MMTGVVVGAKRASILLLFLSSPPPLAEGVHKSWGEGKGGPNGREALGSRVIDRVKRRKGRGGLWRRTREMPEGLAWLLFAPA